MKFFTALFHRIIIIALLMAFSVENKAQYIQKLDSIVNFKYDTTQLVYDLDTKTVFNYNALDQNVYWLSFEYDTLNFNWKPVDSATYQYNAMGQVTQEIIANWNPDSSRYILEDRSDYTYDANNLLDGRYDFKYSNNSSSWDSTYYRIVNYNSNQQIDEDLTFRYDSSTFAWVGDTRLDHLYDSTQKLSQIDLYEWDLVLDDWQPAPEEKQIYVYNSSTQFLDTIYYRVFQRGPNIYENKFRKTFINDPLGNQLRVRENTLDSNFWALTDRFVYDYDTTIALSQIALPLAKVSGLNENRPVSKRNYEVSFTRDSISNFPYLNDSIAYHYSNINATQIEETQKKQEVSIYPNPAVRQLNFEIEDQDASSYRLIIFDQKGRKQIDRIYPNQDLIRLNISKLESGFYLYHLINRDQETTESGKFLVQDS